MRWIERTVTNLQTLVTIRRLRRQCSRLLDEQMYDEAAAVAEQIVAAAPNIALGWHIKAGALVRKCPSNPPDPACETAAVKAYHEAFVHNTADYAIAFGYLSFLNWIGDNDAAKRIVAQFEGKEKARLQEHFDFFISNSLSTRGKRETRNEATGSVASQTETQQGVSGYCAGRAAPKR